MMSGVDPLFWISLRLSLEVALATSLILLPIGIPLAWALAFYRLPMKTFLEAVFLLPLVLPPTVLGFYILVFLGPEGPWHRLTGFTWAFHFEGLVFASVLFSLPFALTAYREAFLSLDRNLLEVARTLGAPRAKIWVRVILPLVWPGVLSGSLLAFAHTLGEFGVVLMVGGSIPGKTQMVSIYLYDLVQALRFRDAATTSLTLLLLSLAILTVARWLEAKGRTWRSTTP